MLLEYISFIINEPEIIIDNKHFVVKCYCVSMSFYIIELKGEKTMKNQKLTKRDLDIMKILWKHEEPIAASEIQKEIPELSKNSILLILKRLLDKEYVYVANISQNKKALMREFSPSVTK